MLLGVVIDNYHLNFNEHVNQFSLKKAVGFFLQPKWFFPENISKPMNLKVCSVLQSGLNHQITS